MDISGQGDPENPSGCICDLSFNHPDSPWPMCCSPHFTDEEKQAQERKALVKATGLLSARASKSTDLPALPLQGEREAQYFWRERSERRPLGVEMAGG